MPLTRAAVYDVTILPHLRMDLVLRRISCISLATRFAHIRHVLDPISPAVVAEKLRVVAGTMRSDAEPNVALTIAQNPDDGTTLCWTAARARCEAPRQPV